MHDVNHIRITGSTALKWWGINRSEPKDVDLWSVKKLSSNSKYDVMVMPEEIIKMVPEKLNHATPDALYTIKCSHLGWSNPAWQKHKLDVLWLKSKGCKLITPLYDTLVDHWKTKLGDKEFLSLDKSKEQFFNDHVTYKVDHDYLHELVAYPNKPVYTKCLKEGKEVLIDKFKFDTMDFSDQVRMFREEISVIALERWVINPYWNGTINWYKAYLLALQKTITNLTKGWATDFIVKNLEEFYKPDFSYFKQTIETLNLGETNMHNLIEVLKNELGVKDSDDILIRKLASGDMHDIEFTYPEELELPENFHDLSWEEKSPLYDSQNKWFDAVLGVHGYEHIMQEGGGEGGSEYCEGVFKLGDTHFHAEWSYYSSHGFESDDCASTLKVVTPQEETITVYR